VSTISVGTDSEPNEEHKAISFGGISTYPEASDYSKQLAASLKEGST
jgi:hypothetical protein